ncbi:MAG TPA: four helix bundle protein [Flavisolibacter sp.]|nr:four helix bundle protein [Flavisolibacter sp.]
MATITSFTDLEIWKLSVVLHNEIFELSKQEPLSKDFYLKDQMNRSSGSVMDNIAEGFGRGGRLEFVQFLTIARGSVSELQSQLYRCLNRSYLSEDVYKRLDELADKTGKKIGAFIKYLNQSNLQGPKFKGRQNEQRKTRDGKRETIRTSSAAKPLGAYPHARRAGNLLFLSGIGSRSATDNKIPGLVQDENGNIIAYNIEAECHSVFANVNAVLEASGSSWEKIIDVTVFLTNMKKDFPVYNKIYGDYFRDVAACRTTVEVKSLPTPIAIELKVIATID